MTLNHSPEFKGAIVKIVYVVEIKLEGGNWQLPRKGPVSKILTLYSIITPLKYHIFKNIMENGAFALLEQMLYFP